MKVSIILPYYGNRSYQLARSIQFLCNQTYENYEVIFVDDGAVGKLPNLQNFTYEKLRENNVYSRSSNTATRRGFELATGDFIIVTHPEILVPFDAIQKMIDLADMGRRNVATQYHLTLEQIHYLENQVSGWETDFDKIKNLPDFMGTRTPWGYLNLDAHTYRNHFTWTGSTRERFEEYLIPNTEEWGLEDAWVHVKELEAGEPSVPIDIEVFHQEHDRVIFYSEQEIKYSVRQQRIRQSRIKN